MMFNKKKKRKMTNITTWREVFERSPRREDSSKIVFCTFTDKKMDEEFNFTKSPYGDFELLSIWTEEFVYAASFRNGELIMLSLPRHPTTKWSQIE